MGDSGVASQAQPTEDLQEPEVVMKDGVDGDQPPPDPDLGDAKPPPPSYWP